MLKLITFGNIRISPGERRVQVNGTEHTVGARAFDLLLYLVEHRDRVVPRAELIDKVWPAMVVEENNLTVQVSALRKILGEGAITNFARRGYRFTLDAKPDTEPALELASVTGATLALPLPDKPSLVVLPFLHLSPDAAQAYLTDGITEDITTELARFRSLFVIARNSAFSYKGRQVDVRAVSRELGVRYVVEGSVRLAGRQMRVTAQLIDALDGGHVWADKFDGALADLFDIQDEVVRRISTSVAQGVQSHEYRRVRERPASITAYSLAVQAYQIASQALNVSDDAGVGRAIALAREALAEDPRCAMAWNALAFALWQRLFFARTDNRPAALAQGLEAADRLIELDDTDAAAFNYRGVLLHEAGETARGLACLRHAHQLNPNDVPTLGSLGMLEIFAGDPADGRRALALAQRINPLDPWAWSKHTLMAFASNALGEHAVAREQALRGVRLAPQVPTPHIQLAVACAGLDDLAGAAQAMAVAVRTGREFLRQTLLTRSQRFSDPQASRRFMGLLRLALRALDDATLGDLQPLLSAD